MLISQSTQNCGGMRSVKRNWKITEIQEMLKIGENLGILPRPNMHFLMSRSKKL